MSRPWPSETVAARRTYAVRLPETVASGIDCAQEVLSAYMTLMKTAHNEPRAFEHAVLTYQLRNPGAGVDAARRAVAMIICSKP